MDNEVWSEQRRLISGQLIDAASGATYDNINPATEAVLGVTADAALPDMDRAIASARHAFDETKWSTNVAFRVHCLRQLDEALGKHAGTGPAWNRGGRGRCAGCPHQRTAP